MPGQQTFNLVPTSLANSVGHRPPMTSKAAKEAYRKATKGPKISRAEQRRLEKEEIDRQKKEYEKEKNASKAKAARDKKLSKEREAREQRKRMGLPEPSRFVRASQPTIKGFTKVCPGRKRSWEDMESDHEEAEAQEAERLQAKIGALKTVEEEDEFGGFPTLSQELMDCGIQDDGVAVNPHQGSLQTREAVQSDDDDDDFGEFPTLSQIITDEDIVIRAPVQADQTLLTSNPLKLVAVEDEFGEFPFLSQGELGLWDTPICQAKRVKASAALFVSTVNSSSIRKPLGDISSNMSPPALPHRQGKHISVEKIQPTKAAARLSSAPPPSTLAFLEAHLDEFFPSPSQQVRELLDDLDDIPSNTQISREIQLETVHIPQQLKSPILKTLAKPAMNAAQETHAEPKANSNAEANTKPGLEKRLERKNQPKSVNRADSTKQHENKARALVADLDLHLFSSQDFEISSQDLREMDTPTRVNNQVTTRPKSSVKHTELDDAVSSKPARSRPKPRFFEEKEDDLLQAALHESLATLRKEQT